MLGGMPTPPLDVTLLECRQSANPILSNRFNQRQVHPARGLPTQLHAIAVLPPVGHVGNEIDPEGAAWPQDARNRLQGGTQIAIAEQRLEDAVRRERHRERARAERQRANVAAHQVQMATGTDRPDVDR